MIELFAEYPWPFFIEGDDTPRYLPRFGRDAKDLLRASLQGHEDMNPDEMDDEDRLKHLSVIIRRLIDKYVERTCRGEDRALKVKTFPKKTSPGVRRRVALHRLSPNDFREAQQRVCSDAFSFDAVPARPGLRRLLRGSVCSVPQFLPPDQVSIPDPNPDDQARPQPVGNEVLSWEDVKAIAMIAVSACSFQVRPREHPGTKGAIMNLFATVLTYPAPSANYRGESEENRSVIQKITYGRFEYPIISPESMRNALREILAAYGLPHNRTRAQRRGSTRRQVRRLSRPGQVCRRLLLRLPRRGSTKKVIRPHQGGGRDLAKFQFKRDSILRMNLARGVEPYRNNAIFTQSPLTTSTKEAPTGRTPRPRPCSIVRPS